MMNIPTVLAKALLCLSLVPGSPLPAAAQEAYRWKVGLASTNITPSEPVRMSGYASKEREQASQGVASDLFAKAMVLEDQDGQIALLLTTDVIGLTEHVSQPLYEKITSQTGLQRQQILINSSHTHTGPKIALERLDGLNNEAHAAATLRYTTWFMDELVELSVAAMNNRQPARLAWGVGVANFVMNRREFTERGVRLGVNPRGLADRSVPVLRIETLEGKPRAVLIGMACHNTTLGGQDMLISGDYAGYAQQRIEQQLPGVQAMFMQGCGGDANPYPRGSEEIARVHGLTLATEALRVLDTQLTPISGPLTVSLSSVELPLQQEFSSSDLEKMEQAGGAPRAVAAELRERLAKSGELPKFYRSQIAFWQFGQDLSLVALPGEVVVDYLRLIEDAIGPRKLWVTAYNHDVFGYLPSHRVLREGGYETRGVYAGGFGVFAPEVEGIVVDVVLALAESAGRSNE